MINNLKYSERNFMLKWKKLYGFRTILTARSVVFDRLLYDEMKESCNNQISFPKINSARMEILLEFIYAGSVKEEFLT